MSFEITHKLIAEASLLGMGLDLLGGLYLAYDLLGGEHGPLRTIVRATGYVVLFLVGYTCVLGFKYAVVAAFGMGIVLAVEYSFADKNEGLDTVPRRVVLISGFARGIVLGLAGMVVAGVTFGAIFGLLAGILLTLTYAFGFSPTADYEKNTKTGITRHKLAASALRALGVTIAGLVAGFASRSHGTPSLILGLKLGVAAGAVSALVGSLSPTIEWWASHLPERRLGLFGIGAIFFGVVLQSMQYWVVVLNVLVR